jgi:serine phosphatase RsbU (regulator of sigma subunit)/PAS domain-containing protein
VVIGTVVLAPFVVSVLAGPRETALVGAIALALVTASAAWNHNFLDTAYLLRVVVVVAGGVVAGLASAARERTAVDRERFALLAAVAEVADGRLTLEQTGERLCELIVPAFADLAIVDVVGDGRLRRLAVKASGPDAAGREGALASRPPSCAEQPGSGSGVEHARPQLLAPATDEMLRAGAHDDADLAFLRSLAVAAAIIVPLKARGRSLGALTLLVTRDSRRGYRPDDLEFTEILAGRAALALDNAGLFTELQTIEVQLTTVLGSLMEAVTVQNPQGNLVYANDAAAALLGFASPQELLRTPPADIVARFESFREDGSPLDIADLPGRKVLAGEEPEPLVVRAVNRQTREEQWRVTKASAVRDRNGHVTMVVNVISEITATKRAELTQRLLAEAGRALASSLEYAKTLQQVAELAVPELADWCAVSLPDDHGRLATVAVAHADPARVAQAREVGARYPARLDEPGGAARVFRDGAAQCVNDITDEMLAAAAQDADHLEALRGIGMRAALLVPMTTGGRSLGVLSLVSAESGRSFSEDDIALAGELARRAATAVENSRLYTERSSIARILQASLLPDELPQLPGWRSAALYRPAGEENSVGGDFYEAFAIEAGWMFVLGDVTGRGAQAAALTALMRHTLRTAATMTGSPARALAKLNRELGANPEMSLCTAVCLVLREAEGEAARADIVCAGHPLPLLVRGGAPEHVGRFGPILGAYDAETWEPVTIDIRDGDVLVLYSDGVLDTVGAHDRFGPERLKGALAGASGARDAVARIDAALAAFQVGRQADDTAVVAVERRPGPLR